MTAPLVSIVLPTYNSRTTLAWSLRSILQQTCTDFEVWVIGDGCTDGSEEVVESFGDARLHWLNLPTNSGNQSVPNNEAISRATGKYVAHLGHDDLWLPDHLSSLVDLIGRTGADFVHGLAALYAPAGLVGVVGAPSKGRTYRNPCIIPSTWLYKREVFDICGPWRQPEALQQAIDVDYVRRISEAGLRIEGNDRVTVMKYPSHYWKAYARTEGWPQEAPCQLIEKDPAAAERQVAGDMAGLLASQWRRLLTNADIRRILYEHLRDGLLAPKPRGLEWVRRATFQYLRRRAWRDRGLK